MTEIGRRTFVDDGHQAELERRGYVVVDLLTAGEVDRLVSTYEAAAGAEGGVNEPGAYNDTYAEFTVIHSRPAFRREAFDAIDDVVGPRACAVLDDHRSLIGQFVNKPPGTGVVPAHQNWSVVDESRFRSVSVWVALTDCTVDNGTLLLADGSHRVLRGRRGMWAYTAFAEAEVRAGQAIVLDDATIHYSAPNRTDRPRLAIQYVMVPGEADALFFQQVGGDGERLEVDVWRVTPAFFFDFWHGDGDPRHGEVVARVEVANPRRDLDELRELIGAGA
jgi:ectoine hydroxylase-related dioxygenase (phytanoyl-CoA dioxygenase family)